MKETESQTEMRFIISQSAKQVVDEFKSQHGVRTYAATINQLIMEYEKLQKEIKISHTLDDVLHALPLLEASITEQIKQAAHPAREARNNAALCLLLLNDMQFESKNKYHYDADSPRLTDAKKQLDSALSKARSYRQESADRKSWSGSSSE